jgi:nitrous oxidase accessory protein
LFGKTAFGILLFVLLVGTLTLAFYIQPVKPEPTTIVVPDDYPTIQQAVGAANIGDTVYVLNGTYYEHLVLNKPLTLVGESNIGTIINGTSNDVVIYVSADNVTIKQFNIATTEGANNRCVYLNRSRYSNVIDNRFSIWGWPIVLEYSHENAIAFNVFDGGYHWHSIDLQNSNNNVIVGNVQQALADAALQISGGHGNFVASNEFDINFAYSVGVYRSDNTTLIKNAIFGPEGLLVEDSNGSRIYHNYIGSNVAEDRVLVSHCFDTSWDADYPYGGNFWYLLSGTDIYSGPYQNETGSDGIMDSPYIIDENNVDHYPLMEPYNLSSPDIGICLTLSKTIIGQGSSANMYVKLVNYGEQIETTNITIHVNGTIFYTSNHTMPGKTVKTLTLTWNTTSFAKGNYAISAYATPVDGEKSTGDNNFTNDGVFVTIAGDVTSIMPRVPDYVVDMRDIGYLCSKFYTDDANCDINSDGRVDMRDIGIACYNFMKEDP